MKRYHVAEVPAHRPKPEDLHRAHEYKRLHDPFSLLSAFADREFRSYWSSTGTLTFLAMKIHQTGFDARKLMDNFLYATKAMLPDYRADRRDLMTLLFQTGYLTNKGFDAKKQRYSLGFTNEEGAHGMLENLMSEYAPIVRRGTGTDVFPFDDYLEEGNLEGMHASAFVSAVLSRFQCCSLCEQLCEHPAVNAGHIKAQGCRAGWRFVDEKGGFKLRALFKGRAASKKHGAGALVRVKAVAAGAV